MPGRAPRPHCSVTWLAIQVLVPLRHFLYPGNVSWTEEGHRFSWHMKLRSKPALASFRLTDPETGRSWNVEPSAELTDRQVRKMAADPFMLLQYAHHLGERASRPEAPRVEVRAIAVAALNGHPAKPFIDPKIDLAAVPRTLLDRRTGSCPRTTSSDASCARACPARPPASTAAPTCPSSESEQAFRTSLAFGSLRASLASDVEVQLELVRVRAQADRRRPRSRACTRSRSRSRPR